MILELENGQKAIVGVRYGEKKLKLRNPHDKPHRTTTVRISIEDNEVILDEFEGTAFCSPKDNFKKFHGRRTAINRAFENDPTRKLSKKDRAAIVKGILLCCKR